MSTTTSKYGLVKPALTDVPDITAMNPNWDTIDSQLAAITNTTTSKYSSSLTYAIGDYCIYNNVLYRCITAITVAEQWNASKWIVTTIDAELDLRAKTSDVVDNLVTNSAVKMLSAKQGKALNESKLAIGNDYRPNLLINGDFKIFERNGSVLNGFGYGYLADRWLHSSSNSNTLINASIQADVPEGQGLTYSLKHTPSNALNYTFLAQRIENVRTLQGRKATISFWAKASANTFLNVYFDQVFDGSPSSYAIGANSLNITTSWVRYSVTIDLPSTVGKTIGNNSHLDLVFRQDFSSASLYLAGVKVEDNDHATPLIPRSYAEELSLCQRYYIKLKALVNNTLGFFMSATNGGNWIIPIPNEMRVQFPTIKVIGNFMLIPDATQSILPVSSVSVVGGCAYIWTTQGANSVSKYVATIDASGASVELDAEL